VFGTGRRKSHRQLAKAELGESLDHLRQAATHAASGLGATVGPRLTAAREQVAPQAERIRATAAHGWAGTVAALAPLAVAAMDGARQAGSVARKAKDGKAMRKKRSSGRRRWSTLAGLLAAGTAVGLAGALVARRRRQHDDDWMEYEPVTPLEAGPISPAPVGEPVTTDGSEPAPVAAENEAASRTAKGRAAKNGERMATASGATAAG
jgi:hypothetical protein